MNKTGTNKPVLYSFRRCPYAIRARMAIKYSQTLVELREIKLTRKPESMLKISAKGTVPLLLLPDNTVIDESIDIVNWALSRHDPDNWSLSGQTELKADALQLIWQNDHVFKRHLDQYKYSDRHPEWPAEHYRDHGEDFLQLLEDKLSSSAFLSGAHISIADISIFPFIRQFALVDMAWFEQTHYSQLQIWLQVFMESSLFNSVMLKYPTWERTNTVIF